jgi:hypothetical protein
VAESICGNSPTAVQASKEIVTNFFNQPPDYAFRLETDMATAVFCSEDASRRLKPIIEDREPAFRPGEQVVSHDLVHCECS